MGNLREWAKKHSSVYCLLKSAKQFFNYDFRDYLLSYRIGMRWKEFILPDSSAMNLSIYQRGELNPDKVVYEIPLDSETFGMCSQLVVLLNRINYAETLGMVPCVNWYKSNLYQEKEPVNGTTNVFEYYFKPINGITAEIAEKSRFVVYDDRNKGYGFDLLYVPLAENVYQWKESDIDRYAELARKYLHLRRGVERRIRSSIAKMMQGKRVLGVHGRGGDMRLAFYNHPISITGDEYAAAAQKAMKKIKADYVFLATDDKEILSVFKAKFGNKLLFYDDVVRSDGRLHNGLMEVERPLHHYLLGYEILRDVYTLASCDGLITGLTMINCVTRFLKRADGKRFEYMKIIDKGRHTNGINVNDPTFVAKDKAVLKKIKSIQANNKLSNEEKNKAIERILAEMYGQEETSQKMRTKYGAKRKKQKSGQE